MTHGSSTLQRSKDAIARLHRADLKYRLNDLGRGPVQGSIVASFNFPQRLMLMAPHACTTQRDGRTKAAEFYVGALVEVLGDHLETSYATALTQYEIESPRNPFLPVLKMFSENTTDGTVVEVHGMREESVPGVDIAVGWGGASLQANEMDAFIAELKRRFVVDVDSKFQGKRSITAKFNSLNAGPNLGLIHLELSTSLRSDSIRSSDLEIIASALRKATVGEFPASTP